MLISQRINRFYGEFGFLSNFHPSPMKFDNRKYPTAEHAYQCAKTSDAGEQNAMAAEKSPGRVKRLGAKCTLKKNWDHMRVQVMTDVVRAKFQQNADLAEQLIGTGDAYLEEGNDWGDTFWGTVDGVGKNVLGNILMQVRTELKQCS